LVRFPVSSTAGTYAKIFKEEYGTLFLFVSLQRSSFSSSAGTYAGLEEYSYEE
jgi:hypothetical protein